MPRRKNRNGHNRRRLHEESVKTLVDDTFRYQNHKQHLKEVETQELLILNRTIFITNVRDLNNTSNLDILRKFFEENYGAVEKCFVTSFGRKKNKRLVAPPANVIFKSESTASKIFGKPLEVIRKGERKNASKLIPSYAAYNGGRTPGKLRVLAAEMRPLYESANLYQTKDLLSKTFVSSSISMGHWVPEDGGSLILQKYNNTSSNVTIDFIEEFTGFRKSKVTLDLRRRLLCIRIDAENMSWLLEEKIFTITFRLKELQSKIDLGLENTNGNIQYSLLFTSKDPPKLHLVTINEEGYETKDRVTRIHNAPFGHCLGFKINLDRSYIDQLFRGKDDFTKKLNDFGVINSNMVSIFCRHITFSDQEKSSIDCWLQSIPSTKIGLLMRSVIDKGKFCSWYDALHDNVQIQDESLNMFQLISTVDPIKARMVLELVSEIPWATRFPSQVMYVLLLEEDGAGMDKLDYCVELPRLVVTPCRKVVSGLETEMSNRVVRHFIMCGLRATDFMRVTICDENGDRISNDDFKSTEISANIKEILLNGVNLNGNEYKFLAYSSSQLKECSVWMVNCSSNRNMVQEIRHWMGNFADIKTPSKYAARMGQCFSTTIQTLKGSISKSKNGYLRVDDNFPDIISRINGKESCHSDGTGLIRKDAMTEILKNVPFGNVEEVSIIQIRFGGAKGTLTSWDNLQPLSDFDVCLRKSMVKFPSPYRHLEVIKVGRHVPYYLNRQMIMLLSAHNVPQSAFLTMQTAMLNKLDEMLIKKDTASEILPQLSGPDSSIKLSLIHMLKSGFSPLFDPFLFSCLYAIRTHHLINLQKKSRIFVKEGAVLIGGLDETGAVPEGCVFIKVRTGSSGLQAINGPVLVAKHPVTHPGDVRMLLAVDIPQLKGHTNVVLFSQYGERSEADKMSGSDLDGDEFAVTWDNRLFLNNWNACTLVEKGKFRSTEGRVIEATVNNMSDLKSANSCPMDFDTQPKANPVDTILDEHLVDHFINFTKADTLGRISMMWLDYAAEYRSAACSPCLELAKLHSIAVDFPKSGVPAIIPQQLVIPSSKPRPHWREKKGESYHCTSTIGKLYDEIIRRSTKTEEMERRSAVAGRQFNKQGQLLCFKDGENKLHENIYQTDIAEKLDLIKQSSSEKSPEDENLSEALSCILFALKQRELYEDAIIVLMNKYRVHSEGELLTGCISKYHRLNKRRRFDLAEEIRIQCRQLRDTFRNVFLSKVVSDVVPQSGTPDDYHLNCANVAACTDMDKLGCKIDEHTREEGHDEEISYATVLSMRHFAQKLAAAYYLVTYHPHLCRFGLEDLDEMEGISVVDICSLSSADVDSFARVSKKAEDSHCLFSFPHLVFDVIAVGLRDRAEEIS